MKIIKPSIEVLTKIDGDEFLKDLEMAGRVCYKSEDKITTDSAKTFVHSIIKSGHESVIEHKSISVKIVCDRGVSHELVRHRIASFSQESTRYCNYGKDKFENSLTFIKPCFWEEDGVEYRKWYAALQVCENAYLELIQCGASPQEARSVLPNSLKTEVIMTANLREWRHFFKLRTSEKAHPQMREVAIAILNEFKELLPVVFDDVAY